MRISNLKILIVALCLSAWANVTGQIYPYIDPILTPFGGSPVLVNQPGISNPELSVTADFPGANDTDLQVINRLSLGVDLNYKKYFGSPMKVRVRMELERWDAQMTQLADTTIHLQIFYNPWTDSTYISKETARFSGSYSFKAVLDSVYVNDVYNDTLPANLVINGEILLNRRTNYTDLNYQIPFTSIQAINKDCDLNNVPDHLHLEWLNNVPGTQEYQLEWLYINNYGEDPNNPGQIIDSTVLPYNFKFNSTRITTSDEEYDISLIFDKGWLLFRLRGVGVNSTNDVVFSNWNLAETGMVDDAGINNSFHIVDSLRHENSLNWQYSATYAEEGKKKEIISYFDGSLRNRQTVTSINTDQNVIVGETIYDYQGRPAINILPVPVVDPLCQDSFPDRNAVLQFYPNFNQDTTATGYSAANFDLSLPGAECTIGAQPMGTQSGASQYYSPNNPDKEAQQAYVPNANLFPFTQVEYTPDNTGRIRRQGGVGPEFQLGIGHETEYLYGQPNQLELDRLFGSEVGDALHYKKNVVIDAHGQASISYLDQEGRVIATALAGDAPENLQGIESESALPDTLTVNAFGQNNSQNKLSIEGNSIVFSTQLLVAFASDYTFNYDFSVEPLQDVCLPNICIDCVYDLTLELVDECGIDKFGEAYQQKLVGKFSGDDSTGYIFHGVCEEDLTGTPNTQPILVEDLQPGSYSFNKRLTINEDARQAFIDLYLDTNLNECVQTLYDFQQEALSQVDSSDCNVNCESCFEALGTLEDYVANGNGTVNDYNLQKEDCERLCNGGQISFCEVALSMMQMDMAKGGQYGEYQNSAGQTDLSDHILSIYRTPNLLPNVSGVPSGAPSWRNPHLIDEYGVHPIYVDMNGDTSKIIVTPDSAGWIPAVAPGIIPMYDPINDESYIYPEQLLSGIDFLEYFEFSWTKSLIYYHPEYCYYETCIGYSVKDSVTDAFSSDSFDELLENTNSFEAAIENGFLPQGYQVIYSSGGNANVNVSSDTENWFEPEGSDASNDDHAWDPFIYFGSSFTTNGCFDGGDTLMAKFNQYQQINGTWYTMPQMAAYLTRCGDNYYTNPPTSCFDFGGPVAGQYDIDILNDEWNALKAMYRSQKQQIKQELADCIALEECEMYCGCIGNEDYNPYTSGMLEPFSFSNPTSFSNSPYFQANQPCGSFLHNLFEQKDRRFPNASDVVPIQNANEAAYQMYLTSGQCPVPFTLQHLLTSLALDGNLDNQPVLLNDYGQLNALFQADNDFNMPGTIPNLIQNVTVIGNTITANWIQNPGSSTYATLSLTKSSSVPWDSLTSIVNLYPTSGNGFEAQGVYSSSLVMNLTGTITTFDIAGCSFANECTLNELGSDIEYLLSALATTDQLTTTTAIDIDPLIVSTATINDLQTLLIENAADAGSDLSWIKISPNEFKLFDNSTSTPEGLYLTFNSSEPTGFNWSNLSNVDYFDGMVSDGQHLFTITAHLNTGNTVILNGSLIQKNSLSEPTGIAVGECELPVPVECQTTEHEAFDALYNVLNEALVTNAFDVTQSLDLFNSLYLESSITSQWDSGLSATSSTYNSTSDTLVITAGDCDIVLTAEGIVNLTQVESVMVMEVTGTTDNFFNYHDFRIKALFNVGSGPLVAGYINGTSCLSIQQCFGCLPDAITIEEFDSIRQERLANGEYFLDNSLERYDAYAAAIDSFNLVNGYLPSDTNFIVKKEYNYFTRNGFNFPTPGYLRHIEHFVPGLDNHDFLRDPDKYVSDYGYGTNVLVEYDRYKESIIRYNTRANISGAPNLNQISKQDFTDARVARQNGEFILYIETMPLGTQGGQNILDYLGANTTATTPEQILYKQYTDAYLAFDNAQFNGTGPQCGDYKKFSPMYAYEDIDENKLLCTSEGQLQFNDYIATFNGTGCPGVLPERKNCLPVTANVTMRDDQKLYILYKEGVKEFNQSLWADSNNYTMTFAFETVHQFALSGYKKDCLKQYLAYLAQYNASTSPNTPSLPPLSIEEFAPCNGIVQAEDPCKEAYSEYFDCVREFNTWAKNENYPYFYKEIPNYETFLKIDACDCVGEFCARLNEIMDGLVSFTHVRYFYNYLDLSQVCETPCEPEQNTSIPTVAVEVEVVDDCLEMLTNQALFTGQLLYQNYIDSLTNTLVNQYNTHCLNINESLTYTYLDKLYHFTLYYYDQAGNLIKTIPPAGVERLNTTNSDDAISTQIASDRTNGTKTVFTTHRMATRYEYNSLNQLVTQSTPDTDPMDIFELTLSNGLHSKLITRKIQMVNENIGYLAGEVPPTSAAGSVRGYLYKTTDGGITWNRVYNLVGSDLKKAVMISEDLGFAIGSEGIVLKTIDGGNTWDMLNSWTTAGMITDLNDITYVDNGSGNYTVTVVGNNGLIAQSTDLQTFSAVSIPSVLSFSSITKSMTHYFATANNNGNATIYTKPLSSGSWSQSAAFSAGGIHSVDITSANRAIIAGNDGRLYINSDISNTNSRWNLVETDITGTITDVNFFNDNNGLVLINDKIHRTVNAGAAWQEIGTEQYKHLSESADGASILAVGSNSKIALVVASNDPTVPIIPVNINFPGLNLTAGWVDRTVSGSSSSTTAVVADGNNIYISHNATDPTPSWTPYSLASVLSGATVKDIKLKRETGNPNQLQGTLLTSSGKLIRFYTNPTSPTPNAEIIPTIPNFITIDKDPSSPLVYGLLTNGSVVKLNLNSPSNTLNGITMSATANQECMVVKGNSIILAGNEIRRVAAPGGAITVQTNKTNPVKLNDVSYQNGVVVAIGSDGSLYQLQASTWKLKETQTNRDLQATVGYGGNHFIVGENGYFSKGNISGNIFTSTPLALTIGGTSESTISEDFFDVNVNGNRMYAVGENGRMLYSPDASTSPFANLVRGSEDLSCITPKVNSLKMIVSGEFSTIMEMAGSTSVTKKDLFTSALIDLNFASSTLGTVLGANYTIRRTNDGGSTWEILKPNTVSAPTALYSEVWTVNSSRSMIFGQGTPMNSTGSVFQNFTMPTNPIQVTSLEKYQDKLYLVNSSSVVWLNLTTNTDSLLSTFTGTAKTIEIFNNGSFAVAGENGLFKYFNSTGGTIFSSSIGTEDINDLKFIDNIYGIAVGDNGAYYKTYNTTVDSWGYLTNTGWNAQPNFFDTLTDPYYVDAYGMVNIYSIDFATPTNGIFGGEYLVSAYPDFNYATECYVRNVFDPNSRYSSRFFYDRLGRLIVSQNARQYNDQKRKFSYTLYDALGRVVEVGEKTENEPNNLKFKTIFGTVVSDYYNPSVIDDGELLAWVTGPGDRREVTKSYYDKTVLTGLPTGFTPNPLTQRKRITHVTYEELFDGDDQTFAHATHYDYDIHGNVKTLLQDNQKMANDFPSIASQRYKRMDYQYDLVSGNVHRMSVQNDSIDQWHHAYRYDADNRIISAHTTKESPILDNTVISQALENELEQNTDWEQDAKYFYYEHGPLARVEIGENQLQGVDYMYNIQGWMKGVNATSLEQNLDPGKDGLPSIPSGINPNASFAKDVYAFGLHYFDGDYTPIDTVNMSSSILYPQAQINGSDIAANTNNLFNGNIKSMQTTLTNPSTNIAMPMANAYQYDQLNRLLSSKSFINLSGNQWGNSGSYDNRYLNTFEYDAMGNITHQNRYTEAGVQIENMDYGYKRDASGNLLRNRLYNINDFVDSLVNDSDIDDMDGDLANDLFNPQNQNIESDYNYAYDEEGRLIRDNQEKIDEIIWRVDGKVKEIWRPSGSGKKNISFDYDAMGNRIAKNVFDDDWNLISSTYYILDAQGNQINVYEHEVDSNNVLYTLKERHIYGSSSLGIKNDSIGMYYSSNDQNLNTELGLKSYSLSNHLGNVLTVISDVKIPLSTDGINVSGSWVGIRNISDYSPFGVLLKERTVEGAFFRLGFQGQERDNEIKGAGNSVNFNYRMHDPRVGRFFAMDPLAAEYPYYSTYSFSGNRVIDATEIEGLEPRSIHTAEGLSTSSAGFGNEREHTYPDGHKIWTVDDGKYWISYWFQGFQDIELNQFSWHASDPKDPDYELGWVRFQPETERQKDEAHMRTVSKFVDTYSKAFAGTLMVMGTGGLGAVGATGAGLTTATINGGVNLTGQLMAYGGDWSKVDVLGVGIAFGSGFVPGNPYLVGVGSAGLDATFDYSSSDKFSSLGYGKDPLKAGNDFLWNCAGNLGGASFGKNPTLYETVGTAVTGIPTNIINTTINENVISPTNEGAESKTGPPRL